MVPSLSISMNMVSMQFSSPSTLMLSGSKSVKMIALSCADVTSANAIIMIASNVFFIAFVFRLNNLSYYFVWRSFGTFLFT